jgi:hypothetical protein
MFEYEPTHQTATWEDVKDAILSNYHRDVVFFISPDNGKEAFIFPKKYAYDHIFNMNADDLKILIVY